MKKSKENNSKEKEQLIVFLKRNNTFDILSSCLDPEDVRNRLNLISHAKKNTKLISLIKEHQRLVRIIPDHNRESAIILLESGIHSALQIAQMTRKDFMNQYAPKLKDDQLAEQIYQNALKKRNAIMLQYMNQYQNNEPHIKTARFN